MPSKADEGLLALARLVQDTGYRFVTVTPETHRRVNARPGSKLAASLRDVFGWSRLFDPAILPQGMFEAMQAAEIVVAAPGGWRSLVRFSTLADEMFVHSAYPTTGADAVFLGPDTYRFCDGILAHLEERTGAIRRAVDIGCGAGPGGILVARAEPSALVTLIDINESALRLSGINAALAETSNIRVVKSDLLADVQGDFDLIVANPPYLLDPAERTYRHGGGELGAALSEAILGLAPARLAPQGTLLLYTGVAIVEGKDPFRAAVVRHLAGTGLDWSYREIDPDVFGEELDRDAYSGADRIAAILLTVRKPR